METYTVFLTNPQNRMIDFLYAFAFGFHSCAAGWANHKAVLLFDEHIFRVIIGYDLSDFSGRVTEFN